MGDEAVLAVLDAEWGSSWRNAPTRIVEEEGRVTAIFATDRGLTGSIPAAIASLSQLRELSLSGNNLTGSIPSGLGTLGKLERVFLRGNQLSGSIPNMFGGLTRLEYVDFSENQLLGRIPTSLGSNASLIFLKLNGNQLSGSIPDSLGNLSNLDLLDLSDNQLSGVIPDSLSNLGVIREFSLRGNELSGEIPPSLGSLGSPTTATTVDLSHNRFSGRIPESLSAIFGVLYLNDNYLSGTLPANLGSFAANTIWIENNCFNLVLESDSWYILRAIGGSNPTVGASPQRQDCVVIEGLDTYKTTSFGANFRRRVTLRNTSPVPVTGKLLLYAVPALGTPLLYAQRASGLPGATEPLGELTLGPGESYVATIQFPTGDLMTPVGSYYIDLSFEGSEWLFSSMDVGSVSFPVTAVGLATNLTGDVTVTRFNGVVEDVGLSSGFYEGDVIQTGVFSVVEIELADESAIVVEPNSEWSIDEWTYDPSNLQGSFRSRLLGGTLDFVSGLMAKDYNEATRESNIIINTQHGYAGIRGTEFTLTTGGVGDVLQTQIDVTSGIVEYNDLSTGQLIVLNPGDSYSGNAPLPSLDTVRYGVDTSGGVALDLEGYTDRAFIIQRSTNLVEWTNWRTVQASELPISLPESSPGDGVFYRLAR